MALLLLVLFAAVVEGGKKGGKGKKGKKGKKGARKKAAGEHPITNDAMPCVACRRMLGHLESSLADAFNKMDAQVMREQVRPPSCPDSPPSPRRPRAQVRVRGRSISQRASRAWLRRSAPRRRARSSIRP